MVVWWRTSTSFGREDKTSWNLIYRCGGSTRSLRHSGTWWCAWGSVTYLIREIWSNSSNAHPKMYGPAQQYFVQTLIYSKGEWQKNNNTGVCQSVGCNKYLEYMVSDPTEGKPSLCDAVCLTRFIHIIIGPSIPTSSLFVTKLLAHPLFFWLFTTY